jgi:hypothetical protein
MTTAVRRALAASALLLLAACGSDNPTSVTVNDLAGTWVATSFVFSSVADPSTTVDAVAAGASFTLTIADDGHFTATTGAPGEDPEVDEGTITVDGNKITLDGGDDPISGTYSLSGNTLTVHLTDGIGFDFTGNGDEPARLDGTLKRQ